uniref:Secreted protein n=1 Tax=Amblyomma triste TaxID=251400 RepID=A0A023G1D0_AMBTT
MLFFFSIFVFLKPTCCIFLSSSLSVMFVARGKCTHCDMLLCVVYFTGAYRFLLKRPLVACKLYFSTICSRSRLAHLSRVLHLLTVHFMFEINTSFC